MKKGKAKDTKLQAKKETRSATEPMFTRAR